MVGEVLVVRISFGYTGKLRRLVYIPTDEIDRVVKVVASSAEIIRFIEVGIPGRVDCLCVAKGRAAALPRNEAQ